MGLMDSLFGGGSQSVKQHIPGYIEDASKQIGYGVKYWTSPDKPFLNPVQQEAIGKALGTAREGTTPFLPGMEGFLTNLYAPGGGMNGQTQWLAQNLLDDRFQNPAMGTVNHIAQGMELGNNPFLSQMFSEAAQGVTDQLTKSLVPSMDRQFAASGRLGSGAYAAARNTAEETTGKALSNLATNLYGQAYEGDKGRQMGALGQLAQMGQQGVQNRLAGAGLFQQGLQNQMAGIGLGGAVQGLNYADPAALYQWGSLAQNAPFDYLQKGANILGSLRFPQQSTQSVQHNPLSQLMGLGGAIGGMALPATMGGGSLGGALLGGMMLSDRRVKSDIKRIGTSRDRGIPIYRYRYLWDAPDVLRVGVMADEMAQIDPSAVRTRPDGLAMVDYDKVG